MNVYLRTVGLDVVSKRGINTSFILSMGMKKSKIYFRMISVATVSRVVWRGTEKRGR